MKFSFDIIDECPSKNDRICENWKETLAAQVWDGELVCSEERESGLRQGQGRSSATSLSLNIVIAANRLMEFWFHAIWICDILLSCHILFGARHASCRSNFFRPAPVSWPDHPVLAIIISFIVASHHHGQTSISHRVSPTLKSSTLSTPISSQPYVDYNLSLFQAAAASCPREIQLTLCTKWHWHQKQHNTKLTNSANCHQGWFSSSNTTLLSSSVTHASVISMKWSPIKMCTCMSMSNLKLTNRQTYSCVKQIIHSEPPPSVIICHPHLTLMYHSPSGER